MAIENASDGVTRTMKASEFKARCLALMDEIAASGEEIVITKRGKPVARLTPLEQPPRILFGAGGEIVISGDIVEPLDVEWEAVTDPGRVLNP